MLLRQIPMDLDPENAKEALEELERGNYKMVLLCTEENTQCARIFGEMLRGVPGYGLIPVVVVAEDNHLEEWARRDIHCYEYLVRPLTEEDYIRIVFPLVSSRWEEKNQQFILIKGQKGNSYVPVEEVIYILKQNRTGYVVTKDKTYEIPYMVLQEYAKFYAENFVQCHRSTIVNRHKIEQVNFTYGFVVAEGLPWDGSITAMSEVCLTPQDFPRIMRENQQEKGKSYEKDLSHTSWKTEQYFV